MSVRLYSNNLSAAKDTAKQISAKHITRFHSQNALFIFIEDIKNPWLKPGEGRYFSRRKEQKQPAYHGEKNYGPIIKYLIEKGVLSKHIEKSEKSGFTVHTRITYEVNKQNLTNFLQTI